MGFNLHDTSPLIRLKLKLKAGKLDCTDQYALRVRLRFRGCYKSKTLCN